MAFGVGGREPVRLTVSGGTAVGCVVIGFFALPGPSDCPAAPFPLCFRGFGANGTNRGAADEDGVLK